MNKLLVLFGILFISFARSEYSSVDGRNNNLQNPSWGSAGEAYVRYGRQNNYQDGHSQPTSHNLRGPREISNIVFSDPSQPVSSTKLSVVTTYWGQFLDHDIMNSPRNVSEPVAIPVPTCDPMMDSECFGNATIRSYRTTFKLVDGVRQQVDGVTSWIDGSTIYGSDSDRASALRTHQGGKMKTSTLRVRDPETGQYFDTEMPPKNTFGFFMDNDARQIPSSELYFLGETRGNENPGLLVFHTIFLREHNRLATKYASDHPDWDDEKLYQEARKYVVALIQRNTMMEYLPTVTGELLLPYTGYDSDINPTIINEFSSAAFRYGHSEVNSYLMRLKADLTPTQGGPLRVKDTYFNPPAAMTEGLEPIMRGISRQPQREVDVHFVEDLRNFLFQTPDDKKHGMDLVAINIMRNREHGTPFYNDARRMFGLPPRHSFSEVNSDPTVARNLQTAYDGDIDKCELYVCGLAEPPVRGTLGGVVGETFAAIIREQYRRLRDGDRFWYLNDGVFSDEQRFHLQFKEDLSQVMSRNLNQHDFANFSGPRFWYADSGLLAQEQQQQQQQQQQPRSQHTNWWDNYM